ncbi:MAG: hypothetical protein KGL25_09875 [Gammaproteobacteria bacterium]|nr:hypothetical protein [Gammaproteobacteria bacterium]
MALVARHVTPVRAFGFAVVAALAIGFKGHLDRYITPDRGLGYWLGIIGGSMMLVLLMYPARKRAAWLRFFGGVGGWFKAHMTLGVLGPLLVLFHANFSLGATNSNVALFCMLAVSGSGLVGRYIYTRVYAGWDSHATSLEELQATADLLRKQTTTVTVLPNFLTAIDTEEQRLFRPARTPVSALLYPVTIGLRSVLARWRLEHQIRRMVLEAARQSPTLAANGARLTATAMGYATRRLDAARRVREHRMYVRLFSLWHFAHVPAFIMTLVAGIVHVISVNVY